MAQLLVKSGKRGRPIKIDVEKTLDKFLTLETRATARLMYFEQTTKGVRFDTNNIGTKAIQTTRDVIEALQEGEQIDYATAKELQQNLNTIKRLASKQSRVYESALSKQLLRQFEKDIENVSKYTNKTTKTIYKALVKQIKSQTPQQQFSYFTSSAYQDPRTNKHSGSPELEERTYAWVEDRIGQRLDRQATLAYIELDKASVQDTGKHLSERGINTLEQVSKYYEIMEL